MDKVFCINCVYHCRDLFQNSACSHPKERPAAVSAITGKVVITHLPGRAVKNHDKNCSDYEARSARESFLTRIFKRLGWSAEIASA